MTGKETRLSQTPQSVGVSSRRRRVIGKLMVWGSVFGLLLLISITPTIIDAAYPRCTPETCGPGYDPRCPGGKCGPAGKKQAPLPRVRSKAETETPEYMQMLRDRAEERKAAEVPKVEQYGPFAPRVLPTPPTEYERRLRAEERQRIIEEARAMARLGLTPDGRPLKEAGRR